MGSQALVMQRTPEPVTNLVPHRLHEARPASGGVARRVDALRTWLAGSDGQSAHTFLSRQEFPMRFIVARVAAVAITLFGIAGCKDIKVGDPCLLAENADHVACKQKPLCGPDGAGLSHPLCSSDLCQWEGFRDRPICQVPAFCDHPANAEHPDCVEAYCETAAPSRYREPKCATTERIVAADVALIPERKNLCDGANTLGMLTSEDPPRFVADFLYDVASYCHNSAKPGVFRIGCLTAMYMAFNGTSLPCSSCWGALVAPAMTTCADACVMPRSYASDDEADACVACIETVNASQFEELLTCVAGHDRCEGVDCNGGPCDKFSGRCL